MLNLMSPQDTLAELRRELKLHEELPRISVVHPVAIELGAGPEPENTSTFWLCAHDDANERKHQISYPSNQVDEQNPAESGRIHGHVARIIAAPYN